MYFEVMPRSGVGIVRFGMTANEVRTAIALPFKSIPKSDTGIPTDSFLDDAVHVFYRQPGVCEAVEFYSPSKVYLQQVNLLNVPYENAKLFLYGLDEQLEEDASGLTSLNLGIGITAPSHHDFPKFPTYSVIVFQDGYYEH